MTGYRVARDGREVEHDLSLNSGERQTAATYDAIRADHRLRYEWADAQIPRDSFGLDVFCGNGYGAFLLSQTRHVFAIDGSHEAIDAAQRNFSTPKAMFCQGYFPFSLPPERFDFVVSLESIEHVPDSHALISELVGALRPGGQIIFSTPCQDHLPIETSGNKFHFRHFTIAETLELLPMNGLELVRWAGQDCYEMSSDYRPGKLLVESEMRLKPETSGQFTIVAARKNPAGRG